MKRFGFVASAAAALLLGAFAPAPLPGAVPAQETAQRNDTAESLLDLAIDRMGGVEALRGIRTVRLEMMTQWQSIGFNERPFADRISYERHTELRDYSIPAWRNTRSFGPGPRTIVDLVRDTVAIRDFGQGFAPLNIAYVDERRQLFAYTPDRLVLALRKAPDLALLPDTTIAGMAHARVRGTVDGYGMTLLLRRADGLPAMVSFRASEPNDYGLVPWGTMDVEVWYSLWRSFENGVSLPQQWDIRRVGQTYKRMTVLSAEFNPELEDDAFTVSDELRAAYLATATKPMHDLPLDSARVAGDFATFGAFGSPAGAVRLGSGWLLLETGQAPLSLDRALDWMDRHAPGEIAAAVVTLPQQSNGGVAAIAPRGVPLLVAPGAAPFVEAMLEGNGVSASFDTVTGGRWLVAAGDSARLEPIDLPDMPGSLLVYVPSLRWLYVGAATQALDWAVIMDRARERGWQVDRIGHARGIDAPAPG